MKFKLEVKRPFIIGSENYLNSSDVIDNKSRTEITMLDVKKLIYDKKIGIKDIENFGHIRNNEYRIDNEYIQKTFNRINNIEKYKIMPPIKYDNNFDLNTLDGNTEIKMPVGYYLNNRFIPYIPGSSIKGAIRNAIRNNEILKNNDILKLDYLNARNIDKSIFIYENENNKSHGTVDIMKFINVSDFVPINDAFGLKIYKTSRNDIDTKENKTIKSYAVMINEGSFTGDIKISPEIRNIRNDDNYSKKVKEKFYKLFGIEIDFNKPDTFDFIIRRIIEITIKHYKNILDNERNIYNNLKEESPLMLGFGGGIEEKTILNSSGIYKERIKKEIKDKNKKIGFNNNDYTLPSTAFMIDEKGLTKFGVLSLKE